MAREPIRQEAMHFSSYFGGGVHHLNYEGAVHPTPHTSNASLSISALLESAQEAGSTHCLSAFQCKRSFIGDFCMARSSTNSSLGASSLCPFLKGQTVENACWRQQWSQRHDHNYFQWYFQRGEQWEVAPGMKTAKTNSETSHKSAILTCTRIGRSNGCIVYVNIAVRLCSCHS